MFKFYFGSLLRDTWHRKEYIIEFVKGIISLSMRITQLHSFPLRRPQVESFCL